MKILMISKALHFSYPGGIQTHVWKISQALRNEGHEVTLLTASNPLKSLKAYKVDGIQIVPSPYLPARIFNLHFPLLEDVSFNLFSLLRIRRWLRKGSPKFGIVHIQGRSGFLYAVWRSRKDPPAVVTFHGILQVEQAEFRHNKELGFFRRKMLDLMQTYATWLERKMLNTANGIIVVGRKLGHLINQYFDVNLNRVGIIPNGLDTSEFFPAPENRIRNRMVCVARLDPRKGLLPLVEATFIASKVVPSLSLHIVGCGDYRSVLERRIAELELEKVISLQGKVSDEQLKREYHEAELFVLPSLQESQGIAFLEAMACGLPVVGFDIDGVNEIITDGVEGFLVEKNNVNDLIRRIVLLLRNKALARKLGANALQRVEKAYRWKRVAELTNQYYHQAVANHREQLRAAA